MMHHGLTWPTRALPGYSEARHQASCPSCPEPPPVEVRGGGRGCGAGGGGGGALLNWEVSGSDGVLMRLSWGEVSKMPWCLRPLKGGALGTGSPFSSTSPRERGRAVPSQKWGQGASRPSPCLSPTFREDLGPSGCTSPLQHQLSETLRVHMITLSGSPQASFFSTTLPSPQSCKGSYSVGRVPREYAPRPPALPVIAAIL